VTTRQIGRVTVLTNPASGHGNAPHAAEKAVAEEQLRLAYQERDQLRRDIAALKQEAESAWASERMETAVMRERINDVAAEVARLTATLEGPNSPIAAILGSEAGHAAGASNGSNGAALPHAPQSGEFKGTLADRIRALQSRASAVPQASGA